METHDQTHNVPVENRDRKRNIPISILAGLSAVVLLSGGATALWTWNRTSQEKTEPTPPAPAAVQPSDSATAFPEVRPSEPTASVPATTSQAESPTAPAKAEQAVQVYWLRDTGTQLELVSRNVQLQEMEQPDAILTAVFEELLEGPEATDVASTIPPETELRSVEVESDGIHVDLSQAFEQGGGSASMSGRLGQVIYTATTLNPSAPVWISVEGEPLKVLGGEGIMVEQPMTREAFEQNFEM